MNKSLDVALLNIEIEYFYNLLVRLFLLTEKITISLVSEQQCTVKPVFNDPFWKDHPVWKDHFPIYENFYWPLDFVQPEPVWYDSLSVNTTFRYI